MLEVTVLDGDALVLELILGANGIIGVINEYTKAINQNESSFWNAVRAIDATLSNPSLIDVLTNELEANLCGVTSRHLINWRVNRSEFRDYCNDVFMADNCIVTVYGEGDLPKPDLV
ncbi:MAG: hypothetical protein Q4C83_02840, partial [Candidatus Saccharibacteria bacterium]|nr:hypothetical protein [Candidatus Saccharibacteria bacterium]